MDLYMQIGVLFLMATTFSLVAYFSSSTLIVARQVEQDFPLHTSSYSLDSSVTKPSFLIDARVFSQWAMSTREQRDVYLVYPLSYQPSARKLGQYMHMLQIQKNSQIMGDQSLKVDPELPGTAKFLPNSVKVEPGVGIILSYLSSYTEQAEELYDPYSNKQTYADIKVETFKDSITGKVIYVCYNQ